MSLFLALALLILTSALCNSPCLAESCTRNSIVKSKSPTFVCFLNVTISQISGCSVEITERILLPHTTGRDVHRELFFVQSSQRISAIRLRRDDKQVDPRPHRAVNNVQRVSMPTEISTTPVLLELSFRLANGVLRMARTCNETMWPMRTNFLSWDSGHWTETIDKLRVHFIASDANETLSVIPGDFNVTQVSRGTATVRAEEVNSSLSVYVRQNSSQICPKILDSCKNGTPGSLAWLAVPASALFICASALCIAAHTGKGLRLSGNSGEL